MGRLSTAWMFLAAMSTSAPLWATVGIPTSKLVERADWIVVGRVADIVAPDPKTPSKFIFTLRIVHVLKGDELRAKVAAIDGTPIVKFRWEKHFFEGPQYDVYNRPDQLRIVYFRKDKNGGARLVDPWFGIADASGQTVEELRRAGVDVSPLGAPANIALLAAISVLIVIAIGLCIVLTLRWISALSERRIKLRRFWFSKVVASDRAG